MSDDDFELFQQELQGVEPLKKQHRANLDRKTERTPGTERRREMAAKKPQVDENHLTSNQVDRVGPHDIISFQRPGVQHGVFRKLRLGKYSIDSGLDLHRMTVDEARQQVFQFVRDSLRYDLRTLLILHGKGERNVENPALLKSYVAHWLREIPDVMAYHSAQKKDGGVGAVYVLIRKSDRLKLENRERYS